MVVKKMIAMVILIITIATILFGIICFLYNGYRWNAKQVDKFIISEEININTVFNINETFYGGCIEDGVYICSLDNVLKVYFWDIQKQESYEVYKSSNLVTFAQTECYNNRIIIIECFLKNDLLSFEIIISTDNGEFIKIYEDQSEKVPYIYVNNNEILINYSIKDGNIYKSILNSIDLKTYRTISIDSVNYSISEDGLYNGEIIMYVGGNNVIYYKKIRMNNNLLEYSNDIKLIKLLKKHNEKKFIIWRIYTYMYREQVRLHYYQNIIVSIH